MKKLLAMLGIVSLLLICVGCGPTAPETPDTPDAQETVSKTPPAEEVDWAITSVTAEDFGMKPTLDDPAFEAVFNDPKGTPLDKLIAFDLSADALGEGSSDEIYQRFLEAPNTVLTYLAAMGTQTVELAGHGDVCAAEMICRCIAADDVGWYEGTEEFDQILTAFKEYYPDGRISELLAIMEEEHQAAAERLEDSKAAWEAHQAEAS